MQLIVYQSVDSMTINQLNAIWYDAEFKTALFIATFNEKSIEYRHKKLKSFRI